ncbi:Hint domain-containing protein [Roseovarius sp. E0-M6]|uniref:Hint domain-containing protein n=1 Tax=Roseovarius sp. E0-M6 TaxID=3127118 RepID=UPI00300FBE9A
MTDQNDDGDIDEFDQDAANGLDVTASWPSDTVTINVAGQGDITYSGTTLYLSDNSAIFTPTDGQVLEPGEFVSSTFVTTQGPLLLKDLGPPCFLPGTRISTPSGQRPVEWLRPGDLIDTVDRGPVRLAWVRRRKMSRDHLVAHPRHAPIVIPAGAFGPGFPDNPLRVSPQHRILLCSRVIFRMYGVSEVLSPAAQLIGFQGIEREDVTGPVEYIHLLFDHHALVLANRLPTESLYLGRNVRKDLSREEYIEFKSTFGDANIADMKPARPFASGKKLKKLIQRHVKNNRPPLGDWRHSRNLAHRRDANALTMSG